MGKSSFQNMKDFWKCWQRITPKMLWNTSYNKVNDTARVIKMKYLSKKRFTEIFTDGIVRVVGAENENMRRQKDHKQMVPGKTRLFWFVPRLRVGRTVSARPTDRTQLLGREQRKVEAEAVRKQICMRRRTFISFYRPSMCAQELILFTRRKKRWP